MEATREAGEVGCRKGTRIVQATVRQDWTHERRKGGNLVGGERVSGGDYWGGADWTGNWRGKERWRTRVGR